MEWSVAHLGGHVLIDQVLLVEGAITSSSSLGVVEVSM